MRYVMQQETRDKWDTFCFYEDAFTPQECDQIIELGTKLNSNKATISSELTVDHQRRKTTISWLEWTPETNWIFDRIAWFVRDANSVRFRLNLAGFYEPLQFTQYTEQDDHYEWHQDFGPGNFSIRKLSAVLQLSDEADYEGGDLQFFVQQHTPPRRKRGTLFIFPSFELHRVTPIVFGRRYSLVAWVTGPPFA